MQAKINTRIYHIWRCPRLSGSWIGSQVAAIPIIDLRNTPVIHGNVAIPTRVAVVIVQDEVAVAPEYGLS